MNNIKRIESLFRFFPTLHLISIAVSFCCFIVFKNLFFLILFFFFSYLFPLLIWRLLFLNIDEGKQQLGPKSLKGSSWLISHYIQYNYFTFPIFERVLIVIPGAFSLWLRLWGSQIGKKVVWTPNMTIYDRPLMIVGDYSIIGDKTLIGGHILKRQNNFVIALIKKVNIGQQVVIGAQSNIGPGAKIPNQAFLPAQSRAMLGRIERRSIGPTSKT